MLLQQSKIVRKEKGVKDFVLLEQIAEDAFMKNLKERYDDETIYTFIGPVVVSVNPYKNLNVYTPDHIELYRGREIYELPPHIFAVASDAHRDMTTNKRHQCIIISGESGAGKTEASKHIMQYIAAVSGTGRSEVNRVKDQLLKSNPVLEAFGNACTNRNDNSSRFGKYMDIQFIFSGDPVGGRISNYLLEKSRVVYQAKGERNFHIFYQVFNGGLVSGKPEDYMYLNQSGNVKVKTIDDAKDFDNVKAAMKVIGFTPDEIANLLNIVAAVINMGNIKFQKLSDGSTVSEDSKSALAAAAKLMGTTPEALATALTQRTVATSRDSTKSPANVDQANYSRDAFAKAMYDRAFTWLVQRINKSILYTPKYGEDLTVIGVLDIYGFEIFEVNSFEQFCINYCNEKLQQLFIELTLKTEQEEYMNEGIQWEEVKYFNNAVICEMIDMSNTGMIAMLDEECLRPGDATDMTFLDKLNTRFKGHQHYESRETNRADKNLTDSVFRIKHYAGDVTYNVANFLDKNTDSLFKDLKSAAYSSSNAILKEIFADGASINEASKRPVTSGMSFKVSLAELVANLKTKNPHYIRCVKPNSKKAAGVFEPELCLHQVRYLGLLENVRVRRAGFAYRQTYDKWFNRFKILSKATFPTFKGTPRDGVQLICKEMKLTDNDYRLGKTKVFIRSPKTLFMFEEMREKVFPRMALLIQKRWRGYKARKMWAKLRACIKIQLKWRSYKSKKYFIVLFRTFEGIRTAPDYGRQIKYPPNPPLLDRFVQLLRKIHLNWRARQIVMKLSPTEQQYVRKKIFTSGIFRGKKPWPINKKIVGDYVSNEAVIGPAFNQAKPRILAAHGSKTVLFAALVTKCNRSGGGQPRGLVLTDKGLYKTDPKNFLIKKPPGWALSQVSGVSLSSRKDSVVVVHLSGGFDLVADLGVGAGGDKAAEFVVELVQAVMKNGGQRPPVSFSDSIQCDANNQKKTLTFQVNPQPPQPPQIVFKKGPGNSWLALCLGL